MSQKPTRSPPGTRFLHGFSSLFPMNKSPPSSPAQPQSSSSEKPSADTILSQETTTSAIVSPRDPDAQSIQTSSSREATSEIISPTSTGVLVDATSSPETPTENWAGASPSPSTSGPSYTPAPIHSEHSSTPAPTPAVPSYLPIATHSKHVLRMRSSASSTSRSTGSSRQAGAVWTELRSKLERVRSSVGPVFPTLKTVITEVLGFADDVEGMHEVQHDFEDIARRLGDFNDALQRYRTKSELSKEAREHVERAAESIDEEQKSLKEQLRTRKERPAVERMTGRREDAKKVAKILRRIDGVVCQFQIDTWMDNNVKTATILKTVEKSADDKLLQDSLQPVREAFVFRGQGRGCMPGTRSAILSDLLTWATDAEAPPIYWLNGMAGTGKTTIAQSFCRLLDDKGKLAANFFCSRQGPRKQSNILRVFPTLAYSMAHVYPEFKAALLNELAFLSVRGGAPDVDSLDLEEQFHILLQIPLSLAFNESDPKLILVVDALDELHDSDATGLFLDILLQEPGSLPVKIFLTSRPEVRIRTRFSNPESGLHAVLRLHDVEHAVVSEDIRLYLTRRLEDIRRSNEFIRPDEIWPVPTQLDRLVTLSNLLFLYASTITRYLNEEGTDPKDRLEDLFHAQSGLAMASLDDTYRFILTRAVDSPKLRGAEKANCMRCLAALICLCRPLSVENLSALLGVKMQDVRLAFQLLHCVVRVPPTDNEPLLTFHASFPEYMTDMARSGNEKWFVDLNSAHLALSQCCLNTMFGLKFNETQTKSSHFHNNDARQSQNVAGNIAYACRYWVDHLANSPAPRDLLAQFGQVLRDKFLYWAEVLSAIGVAHEASGLLMGLRKRFYNHLYLMGPDMDSFLRDANEFMLVFREPIAASTAHVYISALPFKNKGTMIAKAFQHHFPHSLKVESKATTWSRYILLHLQHDDWVTSVALSPDSTRLLSGSEDHTLRLWDLETGKALTVLEGHKAGINSVAFSPDGTHTASASSDRTVRLWDIRVGRGGCVVFEGHTDAVTSVVFTPDGKHLLSGSRDKTIRLWRADRTEVCRVLAGCISTVTCLAVSPDGKIVASGSHDGFVRIQDVLTGEEVRSPLDHSGISIASVAFSLDAASIITGLHDKTLRAWDISTGTDAPCIVMQAHVGVVTSVAVSRDGRYIAFGSLDSTIRLWETETGKEVCATLDGHTGPVHSVKFSPDGRLLLSGGADGSVRLWDIMAGKDECTTVECHTDFVTSVAFSPDGNNILSCSDDHSVRVWNVKTAKEAVPTLRGHRDYVTGIVISPDGTYIYSSSGDRTIRKWHAATGKEIGILEGHTDWVSSLALSHDGVHLVSGSGDKTVRLWNPDSAEAVCVLRGHAKSVRSVAITSKYIASGGNDMTVRIWDIKSRQEACPALRGHTHFIRAVAFSPDGCRIVSGSDDQTIRIWDVETGQAVCRPIGGHTHVVRCLAYSPDGRFIVSGSHDRTIRIWSAETGKEACHPLEGHTELIRSVAFSSDGNYLVSASHDKTILIWDTKVWETTWSIETAPLLRTKEAHAKHVPLVLGITARPVADWPDSGWIVSASGELLFWVPPELRKGLFWPGTCGVIGAHPCVVDLDQFVHGDEWAMCYTGAPASDE